MGMFWKVVDAIYGVWQRLTWVPILLIHPQMFEAGKAYTAHALITVDKRGRVKVSGPVISDYNGTEVTRSGNISAKRRTRR